MENNNNNDDADEYMNMIYTSIHPLGHHVIFLYKKMF